MAIQKRDIMHHTNEPPRSFAALDERQHPNDVNQRRVVTVNAAKKNDLPQYRNKTA